MTTPALAAGRPVDWAQVRREWEGTTVTDVELAHRWGFASRTSIVRRRVREGWARSEGELVAQIAERALGLPVAPADTRGAAGVSSSVSSTQCDTPAATHGRPRGGEKQAESGLRSRQVSHSPEKSSIGVEDIALETERVTGALVPTDDLAAVRVRAVRRQLLQAQRMIETAAAFIGHLNTIATHELLGEADDSFSAEVAIARSRLQAVNMAKDSTSSLMKAFTGMMEAGVKMERLALGLDTEPQNAGDRTPEKEPWNQSGEAMSPRIRRALEMMTEDKLKNLGRAATEVSRMQVFDAETGEKVGVMEASAHTTTEIPPCACPTCGTRLDTFSTADGSRIRKPGRGDFSICLGCGEAMAYDGQTGFQKASQSALASLWMRDLKLYTQVRVAQRSIRSRRP